MKRRGSQRIASVALLAASALLLAVVAWLWFLRPRPVSGEQDPAVCRGERRPGPHLPRYREGPAGRPGGRGVSGGNHMTIKADILNPLHSLLMNRCGLPTSARQPRLAGTAADLGVYERTPELHSLELASAPFIQLTFRLIWGVVSYSPTITKNDLILAEKTCLKGQNRGVQIRTLPVYPQSS